MRAWQHATLASLLLWGCGGSQPRVEPQPGTPSATGQARPAPPPPAESPAQPQGREANAAERRMVAELSRTAERIRGLPFLEPVEVQVQDAPTMKGFVEGQIDDAELEVARTRYVLLGLLEPEVDVRPLLLDLMEEQLVGYYDPDHGLLAIREDVSESLGPDGDAQQRLTLRAVILHELIHALQDQHFDLKSRLDEERTTDADAAVSAVIEGDATLAMIAFAVEGSGLDLQALLENPTLLRRMLGSGMATSGERLTKAPAIVREPLLFPYREGAAFVAELVRHGGWEAVDAMHRVPPPSGGHVLWPERQINGVMPRRLPVTLPAALDAAGVEVIEEDELGPYELGILLEELGGEAGWNQAWVADHLWQLRVEGRPALAWLIAFERPAVARRVEALLEQQPDFRIARFGPRVVLLRNIGEPRADALMAELGARRAPPVLDAPAAGN